ncbi:uncharacterized protein LOC123694826 isoform X2 [Colias croceus]|uniref:uncharacterized protein LOC123694826 isoform X2 n=1 Tax=Colias crocea TaxID=72248 RepID=UPI001E280DEE|nr:uncharacterized protein LOC123694826 isoform X2 [Colias croceus]
MKLWRHRDVLCPKYLPLGDPEVHCATRHNSKDQRLAMCCICDLYMMAVKLCLKLLELIEFFISIFVDLLYEAKLRFYTFLEKLDGKDLCRSVCCFDEKDDPNKKEHRHRSCRCIRSKCKIK